MVARLALEDLAEVSFPPSLPAGQDPVAQACFDVALDAMHEGVPAGEEVVRQNEPAGRVDR